MHAGTTSITYSLFINSMYTVTLSPSSSQSQSQPLVVVLLLVVVVVVVGHMGTLSSQCQLPQ